MTSFTDIEKRALSHTRYGERLRPVRDWLIIVMVGGVLFLLSALWNVWTYLEISSGQATSSASAATPSLDTKAIDTVQNVFTRRAAEEQNYETTYHFVDPSK